MSETKAEKRESARRKARYGMRTQGRWWQAVANAQVRRGALQAPTAQDKEQPEKPAAN